MSSVDYKDFCTNTYGKRFNENYAPLKEAYIKQAGYDELSEKKFDEINAFAQKKAIMETTISAINEYPHIEPSLLWKSIYEAHVHRKSGIKDSTVIGNVISADQSWKKSSGHAFEEIIKFLGNEALNPYKISILLQKDLNIMLKNNLLNNETRDISWLKDQIKANIFDLYTVVEDNNKKYCYGCIQSKTSIRVRVTRDREPSINAMKAFFWSAVIVLDGDFLKNEKFINMVNGGSTEFEQNGWHGMYVFSEKNINGRIYSTDIKMSNFKEHSIEAAKYWLTQRQWFDHNWKAE
jgi:ribosomal protein S26